MSSPKVTPFIGSRLDSKRFDVLVGQRRETHLMLWGRGGWDATGFGGRLAGWKVRVNLPFRYWVSFEWASESNQRIWRGGRRK